MTTAPTPPDELDRLAALAATAAPAMRRMTRDDRARQLDAVADALDGALVELVAVAAEETGIPDSRLTGEVARTTGQLRMFGDVLRDGAYLEVAIDQARPDLSPPRPDLRRMLMPVGPVAVYSASNFPFAFSVAGGDTASALAAGCPVVVKGHSGHPRLSARTAEVVDGALRAAGAPEGAFALVTGRETGSRLVTRPEITAAAFTGSLRGGRALFDLAVARPDPIPFYGELGSLNPVLVTRGADTVRAEVLAAGLAESFQISLGQLCTKPGLVFVPRGGRFVAALADRLGEPIRGRLLTAAIAADFRTATASLAAHPAVTLLGGTAVQPTDGAGAVVYRTSVAGLREHPELAEEHFGPTTLIIEYDDFAAALSAVENLGGTLTATLHAEPGEVSDDDVDRLTSLAGRVLFDGWPTGVAVTWSQTHGGPWPSTSSVHTSVGATAIRRFLRPVTYQSAPAERLPAELRDDNPLGIPRRVDGVLIAQ